MSEEILGERRRALEESFFAKKNRELLEKLKSEQADQLEAKRIAEVSGIQDEAVLKELVAHRIGGGTVAALGLAPLVLVAWADGKMEHEEREAILQAAVGEGLLANTEAYRLLQGWLDEQPDDDLIATWKAYASGLTESLAPAVREKLQADLIGRVRRVAEAAGGFLGFHKVGPEELAVMQDLEAAIGQ
jgi:hypothetical protein